MNRNIDWTIVNEKSIPLQINNRLDEERLYDIDFAHKKYRGEEFDSELKEINLEYELYKTNLMTFTKFREFDDKDKYKFISVLDTIDDLEDVNDKRKLKTMVSYGVAINHFLDINERSNDEIIVIPSALSELEEEDYDFYGIILKDSEVASSIVSKGNDFKERLSIAYDVMDSQDDFDYDYVTRENFDELKDNAFSVINNYSNDKDNSIDDNNDNNILSK